MLTLCPDQLPISCPGSHSIRMFACDCGKVVPMAVRHGLKRSCCAQCNPITGHDDFKVHNMMGKKFGRLTLDPLQTFGERQTGRVLWRWLCDCGGSKMIQAASVVRGYAKTCGCTPQSTSKLKHGPKPLVGHRRMPVGSEPPEYWNGRRFGKLTILGIMSTMSPGSERLIETLCACGTRSTKTASMVIKGATSSCGRCKEVATHWWNQKSDISPSTLRQIGGYGINPCRYPLWKLVEYFSGFHLVPLESTTNIKRPTRMLCLQCNAVLTIRIYDLITNQGYGCKCFYHFISKQAQIIATELGRLGLSAKLEHRIGKWSFDILVGNKTLVEYDGEYWHEGKDHTAKDRAAQDAGFKLIRIPEKLFLKDRQAWIDRIFKEAA
jgi:hypothetical protein